MKRKLAIAVLIGLSALFLGQTFDGIGIRALISSFGGMTAAAPTDMLGGLPLDIQNFDFRSNGADAISLVKRKGFSRVGDTKSGYVGGVYPFTIPNQPTQLVASIGTMIHQYNSSIDKWQPVYTDVRAGSCVVVNGSDTVKGLGTNWWPFSTENYTSIKLVNATTYTIGAILGDSVIVLASSWAGATDSAAACTLVGSGTLTATTAFTVEHEDKIGIRDGDTLYIFGSSDAVKYVGTAAPVTLASPDIMTALSDWDRRTASCVLSGARGIAAGDWVQVQPHYNTDYNIALYSVASTENSVTLRCDTSTYDWLASGTAWSVKKMDSLNWDTTTSGTISAVVKDSVLLDSSLVDSSMERVVLENAAPSDHPKPACADCQLAAYRVSRSYKYRYLFHHKVYATSVAGFPESWAADSAKYMTRRPASVPAFNSSAAGIEAGEYYNQIPFTLGRTIDTLGSSVPDTGYTLLLSNQIGGACFTSSSGNGVNLYADSAFAWLIFGGSTSICSVQVALYRWNSGTPVLVDTSNIRVFTFASAGDGLYGFDLVNDSIVDSATQYCVVAWAWKASGADAVSIKTSNPADQLDSSGVFVVVDPHTWTQGSRAAWPDPLVESTLDSARCGIFALLTRPHMQLTTVGLPGQLTTTVYATNWRVVPTSTQGTVFPPCYSLPANRRLGYWQSTPTANPPTPDSIYGSLSGTTTDTFFVFDTAFCWVCYNNMEYACAGSTLTTSICSPSTATLEVPPGPDSLHLKTDMHIGNCGFLDWYNRGGIVQSQALGDDGASTHYEVGDSLYAVRMIREPVTALANAFTVDTSWQFPIVASLLDRHWCTGDKDRPELVKVTVDALPTVFTDPVTSEVDSFYVRDKDRVPITALGTDQNILYVHKPIGVWSVPIDRQTLDPTGVFPTQSRVGALAMRGLVETPRGHFFIANNGVYHFDGSNSTLISDPLNRYWRDSLSAGNLDRGTLVYDILNNRLLASVPRRSSSVNDVTLVFDFNTTLWTKYTMGMGIASPIVYPTSRPVVYFSSPNPNDGDVFKFADVMRDTGSAFSALWRTGWLPLDGFGNEASIKEWFSEAWIDTGSSLVFSTFVNGSATAGFVDTTATGAAGGWQPTRRAVNYVLRGKYMSFQVESQADTLEVSGLRVDYSPEGVMLW